uniref:Uncharacterized protein n=1 Tax=Asparagus officinalis TaxID=4686 RepID=Q2AA58_ASPOF|nr:hypothetical protein 19.t00002 [Asparagus officinalis]
MEKQFILVYSSESYGEVVARFCRWRGGISRWLELHHLRKNTLSRTLDRESLVASEDELLCDRIFWYESPCEHP